SQHTLSPLFPYTTLFRSEQSTKSANTAAAVSVFMTIFGTLLALIAGGVIAFYTARSITEPLNHLMTVSREIGDSGDLDQNIDIRSEEHTSELQSQSNLVC